MKYLIVTADDLGLTGSINEGIARAYCEGIVTDTSVIPTGEAFDDAVRVVKNLKLEGIGAHLALTETRPLLKSSRFYRNHNAFFFKSIFGDIDTDGIYDELKAQVELLRSHGLKITHINSHEHIHVIPKIFDIFLRIAKEYNIPAIRFPASDRGAKISRFGEIYKKTILSYFAPGMKKALAGSMLMTTDFFIGLLDAGKLHEDSLLEILKNLKDGVTELVTHPGFLSPEVMDRYSWHAGAETELAALTANRVRNAVKRPDIRLVSFGEFAGSRSFGS